MLEPAEEVVESVSSSSEEQVVESAEDVPGTHVEIGDEDLQAIGTLRNREARVTRAQHALDRSPVRQLDTQQRIDGVLAKPPDSNLPAHHAVGAAELKAFDPAAPFDGDATPPHTLARSGELWHQQRGRRSRARIQGRLEPEVHDRVGTLAQLEQCRRQGVSDDRPRGEAEK